MIIIMLIQSLLLFFIYFIEMLGIILVELRHYKDLNLLDFCFVNNFNLHS